MKKEFLFLFLLFIYSCSSDIHVEKNLNYIKNSKDERQKLDIYYKQGLKKAPVLIFAHGGAWRSGSKDNFNEFAMSFAKEGIIVVVPNYRLSPLHKHPSQVSDLANSFKWVRDNIASYGGNPNRIFLSGHSSGGHLVSLLALDRSYLGERKNDPAAIAGVIAISSPLEISFSRSSIALDWYKENFGEDTSCWKNASPYHYINRNSPKFLLIYGGKDYEVLNLIYNDFKRRLDSLNIENSLYIAEKYDHVGTILYANKGTIRKQILSFILKD
ncbi:MAG: alpha/beta hydrolase [Candidatus Coatesbacteria bacterium]|nr:alpha/beta hydrolase [Candidatus Coatesbacteria bacterium]